MVKESAFFGAQENTTRLIPYDQFINEAVRLGVKFGKTNPYHRIRYYIKLGLLPNPIRKVDPKVPFDPDKPPHTVGHFPAWTANRLWEIEKLKSLGLSANAVKDRLTPVSQDGKGFPALNLANQTTPNQIPNRTDPPPTNRIEPLPAEDTQDIRFSPLLSNLAYAFLTLVLIIATYSVTLYTLYPQEANEFLNNKSRVLGTSDNNGDTLLEKVGGAFKFILTPFSRMTLGLLKISIPESTPHADPLGVTQLDRAFVYDIDGNLVARIPISFESAKLLVQDEGLVEQLNADLLDGHHAGTESGQVLVLDEEGDVDIAGGASFGKNVTVGGKLTVKKFIGSGAGVTNLSVTNVTGTFSSASLPSSLVYTNTSYANPSWITSFAWTKIISTPNILSSLDGVVNDEGNINLIGGGGISITPNNAANTITISGGGASGFVSLGPAAADIDTSANPSIFINDTGGGNLLQLQSGSTNRFVIDNSGNVGIGNTEPLGLLHINDLTGGSGEPTYHGKLIIAGESAQTLDQDLGIEFKSSWAGNGYGWRISNPDLGSSNTPLVFESRNDSATWLPRVTMLNSGNVGIGTTGPNRFLHLKGNDPDLLIDINSASIETWGEIHFAVDGIEKSRIQYNKTTGKLILQNNNIDALVIDTSGNVGIGTASPWSKLTVLGSDADPSLTHGTADAVTLGSAASLVLSMGQNASGPPWYYWMQVKHATDDTSGTLSINPLGGNVGIGTTNPQAQLDIEGDGRIRLKDAGGTNAWTINVTPDGSGNTFEIIEASTLRWSALSGSNNWQSNGAGTISTSSGDLTLDPAGMVSFAGNTLTDINAIFGDNSGGVGSLQIYGVASPAVGVGNTVIFYTDDNAGGEVERLKLTRGTAQGGSPILMYEDIQFDLADDRAIRTLWDNLIFRADEDDDSGGDLFSFQGNGTNTYLLIDDSGNVGIGETNPGGRLEVAYSVDGSATPRYGQLIDVDITTSNQTADLYGLDINLSTGAVDLAGSANAYGLNVDVTGVDDQSTGAVWAATFQGGNVGIGTAAPAEKLEIDGITDAALYFSETAASGVKLKYVAVSNRLDIIDRSNSTDTERVTFLRTGEVGIGTTSPDYKLQVRATTSVGSTTADGGNTGTTSCASGGTYRSYNALNYKIEIDGGDPANPNTFKWSDDGGSTWDVETVAITGAVQTLNYGVTVTFDSTTGADTGDFWTFSTTVSNPFLAEDESGNDLVTILNNGYIGIGEVTPAELLHLHSAVPVLRFSGAATAAIEAARAFAIDINNNDDSETDYFRITKDNYATELLRVQEDGNVGIGDITPTETLTVADDFIGYAGSFFNDVSDDSHEGVFIQACLDTNPTSSCNFLELRDGDGDVLGAIEGTGGGGVTYASPEADYAELFGGIRSEFEEGDVIAIGTNGQVVKAESDSPLLGVFSAHPNTLGNWKEGWEEDGNLVPAGLLGQIETKVSAENGSIVPGDPLTSSSTPGVAMKATSSGPIVGKALEAYGGSGVGKIMVFVSTGWYVAPLSEGGEQIADLSDISVSSLTTSTIHTDVLFIGDRKLDMSEDGKLIIDGTVNILGDIVIDGDTEIAGDLKVGNVLTVNKLVVSNINLESSGNSTLSAGKTKIFVPTPSLTSKSQVSITTTTLTGNNFNVTEKVAGQGFTVEVVDPEDKDINFDWFVIN